jgi:hypothetical protein
MSIEKPTDRRFSSDDGGGGLPSRDDNRFGRNDDPSRSNSLK